MNQALKHSYNTLKEEVAAFRKQIVERLPQNEDASNLYKGCTIMYSHLIENPPFLFIGINPGGGTNDDPKLDPCMGFEYLNALDDVDYALARETRGLFTQAFSETEMLKLLNSSVKTNVYYFITTKANDLWNLFSSFGNDANRDFHCRAFKWTEQMIKMVKPKVIVCEGIIALNKISEIYNKPVTREGTCGYFELDDRTLVFGYSRTPGIIKDKPIVAKLLRKKVLGRI